MLKLRMSIAEFRRRAFVGRAPSSVTVRRWIQAGQVAGERIGGTWFVLVDESGQPLRTRKAQATGNVDADAIIMAYQASQ
jgi:hypothetical protein